MIIRNFLQTKSILKPCHQGKGLVKHVNLFRNEDFQSPLRFIIYLELQPGTSVGYHEHGANEEVYVILQGQGELTVNGQKQRVGPGDTILNKAGWSHGLQNDSQETMQVLVCEAPLAEHAPS